MIDCTKEIIGVFQERKSKKMKRIPQILLCLFPYILLVGLWVDISGLAEEAAGDSPIGVYGIILIIIFILNIINAIVMCRRQESLRVIAFWNLIIKLVHIPFYGLIFTVGIISVLLGLIPVPFMIFIGMGIVICLVIVDYIVLLSSTIYGIAAVRTGCKYDILSKKEAIWYFVMHFIFCLDVIAALLIYRKARRAITVY